MFSTKHGKYAPRAACQSSIIIRSSPEDDQEAMIARLRQQYPTECGDMTSLQPDIYQYYDPYDANIMGTDFLYSVLATIAWQNLKRSLADVWGDNVPEQFDDFVSQIPDAFTEVKEYGSEFLANLFAETKARTATHATVFRGKTWRQSISNL